jgi:hypothetical protein
MGLILPFPVINYTVHFIKLFPEEFQQYTQYTINNFKVLTQSIFQNISVVATTIVREFKF